MDRYDVEFLASANDDLIEIYDFIADSSGNRLTALNFVTRIHSRCLRIGDAPRGGVERNDLHPGIRLVPFERSAVIAYLIEDRMIQITNIFYGGRDFEALMRTKNDDTSNRSE